MSDVDLSRAELRDVDFRGAYLRGSDFRGANLRDVDFRDADLRDVDFSGADLRGADLIVITWEWWTTYITKGHIRIGCQSHTLQEWKNFSDEEIIRMGPKALEFCKQNKELIIGLCERFETNKGEETK